MKDGTEGRGRMEGLGGGTSTLKGPCHSGSHYRWTTTLMSQRERGRGRERSTRDGDWMGKKNKQVIKNRNKNVIKTKHLKYFKDAAYWVFSSSVFITLWMFCCCFHLFIHLSIIQTRKNLNINTGWCTRASVFQLILFGHITVVSKLQKWSKKVVNVQRKAPYKERDEYIVWCPQVPPI